MLILVYATEDAGLPQDEIHAGIPDCAFSTHLPLRHPMVLSCNFSMSQMVIHMKLIQRQGYCTVTVTQISPTFEAHALALASRFAHPLPIASCFRTARSMRRI